MPGLRKLGDENVNADALAATELDYPRPVPYIYHRNSSPVAGLLPAGFGRRSAA
jgi:hypothetical protein